MKKMLLTMAVVALVMMPMAGMAASITIPLDTAFSNYDPPLTGLNFGTVEISEIAGGDGFQDVQFKIVYPAATGTGGPNADLQWFYFNINPNPNPLSNLVVTAITGNIEGVKFTQKADGSGNFDYEVDYGAGANPTVQTAIFSVSLANTNLSITNFADGTADTKSEPSAKGAYTVAAHFQSTNFQGNTSEFVGGNPPVVPIPGSLLLLGSGILGLVGLRRKLF